MRRTSPPAAGAPQAIRTTRSSVPFAARCGNSRYPCSPRRTPSHPAKSAGVRPRKSLQTMEERENNRGWRSIAKGAQEAERAQAGHGARPRRRAGAGDLRVVVAHVLPALPQREGNVRGRRAATPRAGLLVRSELADHIEPGQPHSGALRNPRRTKGRRLLPGSVNSTSARR